MRLSAQMFEDEQGRRSVKAAVYLHGPAELEDLADTPEMPIDDEPGGGAYRRLAELVLLASDRLDEERFVTLLHEGMREALIQAPSEEWIHRDELGLCFERLAHVEGERTGILDQLIDGARVRLRRRELKTYLRISLLELKNFRGVDRMELPLSSNRTTVLIGANGSGKTTLLEAAALLLSHLQAGIARSREGVRRFADADVLNGRDSARLSISAEMGGRPIAWSLVHARGGDPLPAEAPTESRSLDEGIAEIHSKIERGDVCIPLAVCYSVNRAVLDIPLGIRAPNAFESLAAYDGALVGEGRPFGLFFEWFRGREDIENESRINHPWYRDNQLEAVRRAIESLMPGFTGLRVKRAPPGMIIKKGKSILFVDQLSDGEKCLLAMTGDLARRLAMANPYMDDPLQGGGVVLIDEIELHLHPSWQRQVIPALERTFPNCQFIVTTHSPAVIGHVHRDSLFLLKPDATGIRVEKPSVSLGLDANRVLLEIMGVDERPHDIKVRFELIYTLLGDGKLQEARREIEKLEAEMGHDPELAKAATMIRRKEAIGR
jgi:hypothetical protein